MANIEEQLKEHLQNAKDWEAMDTPVLGVKIVKVPATKTRMALLMLELNPIKDDGKPIKRKGLFVANKEMLIMFSELLSDDKVFQLIQNIENINPENNSKSTKKLNME